MIGLWRSEWATGVRWYLALCSVHSKLTQCFQMLFILQDYNNFSVNLPKHCENMLLTTQAFYTDRPLCTKVPLMRFSMSYGLLQSNLVSGCLGQTPQWSDLRPWTVAVAMQREINSDGIGMSQVSEVWETIITVLHGPAKCSEMYCTAISLLLRYYSEYTEGVNAITGAVTFLSVTLIIRLIWVCSFSYSLNQCIWQFSSGLTEMQKVYTGLRQ